MVMLALTVLILTTERLAAKTTIRVGHFPNVTHAQGLVAHASPVLETNINGRPPIGLSRSTVVRSVPAARSPLSSQEAR
jgi:hypothetical protein